MYRIGIDASGGDFGETEVIKAVAEYLKVNADIQISIFGVKGIIDREIEKYPFLKNNANYTVINSDEKIEMNDHPVIAIRTKTNSSLVIATNSLINHSIDALISAGNTGALVALAQFYLKPIQGVDRPVIGAIVPTSLTPMLLIDSGCNVDSKPEWLYQYALLADSYYRLMFNRVPSIGLLSIGVEENKGNNLTFSAYKLISNNNKLNFIGNVEARELARGICDVVITDGFTGNVFLKTYEGTAKLMLELIKTQINSSLISKIGGLLIKPSLKKLLKKYDAKVYGGAPILGANSLIIKCHGNSKSGEFITAISQAKTLIEKDIINVLRNNFKE